MFGRGLRVPMLSLAALAATQLPQSCEPPVPVPPPGPPAISEPLLRPGEYDSTLIPQFVTPLVIPPVMPKTSVLWESCGMNCSRKVDYYEIALRQFEQQVLPSGLPPTTVWSYGAVQDPATLNYPAFTIEATFNRPVRVKWKNKLVDEAGNYLPHLLAVDPTLHWANPGRQGGADIDDTPPWLSGTPGPYTGPVPMVVHLHGAVGVAPEHDGYPEAWFLPAANNIPAEFARVGSFYDYNKSQSPLGSKWSLGSAVFEYPNVSRAATLWYHDHSLGMTRLNVYAGPAGFYLLRGGPEDRALRYRAPQRGDGHGVVYTEIPIAVQDRSFRDTSDLGDHSATDGALFYPASREFFDGYAGPFIPETDVPPIWNPEVFGNTMVANGKTWPTLDVERRRYRFRFLNGCNSRTIILKMVDAGNRLAQRPVTPYLTFAQIGTEGGFLPAPVTVSQLLLGPAERADVIVDFGRLPAGTEVFLINEGPDAPFGGGVANVDFPAADAGTTGQVMRFVVKASSAGLVDPGLKPQLMQLPPAPDLGPVTNTRMVSLNEMMSMEFDGPVAAMLGTVSMAGPQPEGVPLMWDDDISENPAVGSTEIWEIYNFTMDAHPIHLHEVYFQVIERQAMGGVIRPPEAWESGPKDTVLAYPGEITRIKARFDREGLFVWHCHIVEHEDNEMMRPYFIGTPPPGFPLQLDTTLMTSTP